MSCSLGRFLLLMLPHSLELDPQLFRFGLDAGAFYFEKSSNLLFGEDPDAFFLQ